MTLYFNFYLNRLFNKWSIFSSYGSSRSVWVPLFNTVLFASQTSILWLFSFCLAQNRNLQLFPCGPHYKSIYHYRDRRRLSNTLLLLLYGTHGHTRAAVWFVQFSTSPSAPLQHRTSFVLSFPLNEMGLAFLCMKELHVQFFKCLNVSHTKTHDVWREWLFTGLKSQTNNFN